MTYIWALQSQWREIKSLLELALCLEFDEDKNPKSGPIQYKPKPNYEVGKKPKPKKPIFDLIW